MHPSNVSGFTISMLLRIGVIGDAVGELDMYLHKVVLIAGREDRPA